LRKSTSTIRELSLASLARVAGIGQDRLVQLARFPERSYRRRYLTDDRGKRRELLVPAAELKQVQTRLYRGVLRPLKPHPAAACVRGRGVLWTVNKHARRPALLHEDIADFYPNVRRDRVMAEIRRVGASYEAGDLFSRLVTVFDQLPQGAPTSTAVGDLVLFRLDRRLYRLADSVGLTYTRYVDDLAISGGEQRVRRFAPLVKRIVAEEGWELNGKGGIRGGESRHFLLGAVINSSPNASREYRRAVRSVLRMIATGRVAVTPAELRSLSSKVAWVAALNPLAGEGLRSHLVEAVPDAA
jgi:hypothetical protein